MVVVLGAITIGVATRKRWQTAVVTAVVTVCGILAAVAAVRMFRPVSMQVLAICVLVGLLVLIRMTPTVALWVARVRPPHFGSITGRDLFARRAGMPVDTVAPVSEADADDEDNELTDITARGTAIAASARLVNAVQVGMCVGVSLVLRRGMGGADATSTVGLVGVVGCRLDGGPLHHPGPRVRRQIPSGRIGVRGVRRGVCRGA